MRDLAIQMARKIHILKMVTLAVKDLFSAFKSLTPRFKLLGPLAQMKFPMNFTALSCNDSLAEKRSPSPTFSVSPQMRGLLAHEICHLSHPYTL